MRIGLTSIYVDDQYHAEEFYPQVLGFKVKTSIPYGHEERWLSLVAPEDPDGVESVVGRWRSEGHIVGDQPVPITRTHAATADDRFMVAVPSGRRQHAALMPVSTRHSPHARHAHTKGGVGGRQVNR
jgi:hypothetical protein